MLTFYDKSNKGALLEKLSDRADNTPPEILSTVASVIADIRRGGDSALRDYTSRFDHVDVDDFLLSDEEAEKAVSKVDPALIKTMEKAAENIRAFHEKQLAQSVSYCRPGVMMGQRVIPLSRVGLYVPGGTAAYPSSVLMNAIPAKVAGVKDLVMATPPKAEGINPAVAAAAKIAGVDRIITAGGAQVIAALAYGTETIKRVDKIVGPGNIFVATAKRLCYGAVDIDMIAGPSEVLVIADKSADPAYIAADLMAQAEHDPRAAAILITVSKETADAVDAEIERQIKLLPRAEVIRQSLESYGSAIVADSVSEAIEISNEIAPEHLELAVNEPFARLGEVENAGSVFLGANTPEPLGDYFAGPNHVLPTNGTARFSSGLNVQSFVKRSTYLCYDRNSLLASADDVVRFARAEGLDAHANSIIQRQLKER